MPNNPWSMINENQKIYEFTIKEEHIIKMLKGAMIVFSTPEVLIKIHPENAGKFIPRDKYQTLKALSSPQQRAIFEELEGY